jgi:type IV pilus assembly protein PilN
MNRYTESNTGKNRGRAGSVVSEADYTIFLAKVKNVNNILYKRSYDWLSLLDNMEQLVPAGVSLKSLEPLDKGESLRLAGSANDFSSVRRFVENLESSKTFTDIYLTDQASAKIDNQRKVINFTVTCKASIR